jgi:hypothetical protein
MNTSRMQRRLQRLIMERLEISTKDKLTLKDRIKVLILTYKMNKLSRQYAKQNAIAMYKESYELCQSIIKANFK